MTDRTERHHVAVQVPALTWRLYRLALLELDTTAQEHLGELVQSFLAQHRTSSPPSKVGRSIRQPRVPKGRSKS